MSREALWGLFGVILGFALAVAWDVRKTSISEREELQRAVRSIEREGEANLRVIAADISYLDQDSAFADSQREIVQPVDTMAVAAGETAYLKGSLEGASADLAIELGNVYSALSRIDLSPKSHPGMSRVRSSSEPVGLGGATGRGA